MSRSNHSSHHIRRKSLGFTLVELLVVITIIGILIALLLPAVQAAREAARRLQCTNNLKQLALAALTHEQAIGHFPTNGWGWGWVGDPDRGSDQRQPGGWPFNLLPYIEQQPLHDLQSGLTGTAKKDAATRMVQTPLGAYMCPSRREVKLYPMLPLGVQYNHQGFANTTNPIDKAARIDYAGNGGDIYTYVGVGTIYDAEWNVVGSVSGWHFPVSHGPSDYAQADAAANQNDYTLLTGYCTGVFHFASKVTIADVKDGTSNTYLIGEKYQTPDTYDGTIMDNGDNETLYGGDNEDFTRWATIDDMPAADTPGLDNRYGFGSAHVGAFNMSFCDGSVQSISYSIDFEAHRRLACRRDGLPVDADAF